MFYCFSTNELIQRCSTTCGLSMSDYDNLRGVLRRAILSQKLTIVNWKSPSEIGNRPSEIGNRKSAIVYSCALHTQATGSFPNLIFALCSSRSSSDSPRMMDT